MSGGHLTSVRGMHDLLPDASSAWLKAEARIRETLRQYAFNEIRVPIVESAALFTRAVGTDTDIVTKEMYRFADLSGEELCLRPEGTAGVARAALEHGLTHNQIQRLWYLGPMFRRERPQKGRYRQFHQLGVEAYGLEGPDIDAQLLLLCARLWEALGASASELGLELQINSLGSLESRQAYRKALSEYFQDRRDELDAASLKRLEQNPLRILDSKRPDIQNLIRQAPSMLDYLDPASRKHFEALRKLLDQAGLAYRVNPRLVRGLDYYERTVFEWVATEETGAQNAVCAGGRYDRLLEMLGGRASPAIGFALGMERLLARMPKGSQPPKQGPDIYFACADGAAPLTGKALALCEALRRILPELSILQHLGGGNLKKQLRRADQSGARIALILGAEEAANKTLTVKFLRESRPQKTLPSDEIAAFLRQLPWERS